MLKIKQSSYIDLFQYGIDYALNVFLSSYHINWFYNYFVFDILVLILNG